MVRVRLLAAVLTVGFLVAASYQDKDKDKGKKGDDTPPVKVKGTLPQHYGKLGLTDEQKQKVYKVRADYKAKIDDLTAKIEKLKGDRREAEEKVLTKEQLKRLRELRSGGGGSDK